MFGSFYIVGTPIGNIEDITYGLSEVLQIRPVEFDWKEKRNKAHDIGVIAQEIESIIPVIVKSGQNIKDKTPFKTVDYSKLTAVLIKAIQEQDKKIDKLQEDINELRRNE